MMKLAGGTAIAQAIYLAATPVITRLYTPEQFGSFGIFTAIVGFGTVLAAWRLEQAVLSADSIAESAILTKTGMKLSVGSAIAFIAAIAALPHLFEVQNLNTEFWFAPLIGLTIFLGSTFFLLRAW